MLRRHVLSSAVRPSRLRPWLTFRRYISNTSSPPETQDAPPSQPAASSRPILPLSASVRSCMRLSPHPLTIILSSSHRHLPSDTDNKPTITGLLVSSFNSITLSPTPFVSFNIKLPSTTYSAILSSGYFSASGINSQVLAQVMLEPASPKKQRILRHYVDDKGGRTGGAPVLKDEPGMGGVWWMQCEWIREMSLQAGDHMIVVGEVLAAGKYTRRNERKGLVYLNGNYMACGNPQGVRRDRFGARNKEEVVTLQERVKLFGEGVRELTALIKQVRKGVRPGGT